VAAGLGGGAIGAAVGDGLAGSQTIARSPAARDREQGTSVLLPDRRPGRGHVLLNLLFMVVFVYVFAARADPTGAAARADHHPPPSPDATDREHGNYGNRKHLPTSHGTFFVELLVFLIIVFLITKYILPPLNRAMEKRQEEIRASLESAERARTDAAAADDERRTLEEARQQAARSWPRPHTAEQVAASEGSGPGGVRRIVANATRGQPGPPARRRRGSGQMGELVLDVVERIIGAK